MKTIIRIFLLLVVTKPFLTLGMDNRELLRVQRIYDKLNFDGICNDPAYDQLEPLPLSMYRPNHGSNPTERSEIFITFDDEHFYLSARLYYENGAKIRATTKKRDGADGGNDNFGILLDTFNDNENALCFETNPTGLRSDFSIANDAEVTEMMRPFNRSWNTFWDIKTTYQDNIWHVEMQIPLSSLRFQEVDGQVIMGLSIWRIIASKQEWSVFPLISNEFGSFGVWKPSQAKKIVLEGITRKNPVYITPYGLTSLEQTSELSENGQEYLQNTDTKLTAGLDIKYSLTSNLTMDLTLNTDFAQVEVDDQMVNLTRFSLFFPEKRQFFVERSSIFTIQTGYLDQLFYSRRIGLYEGEIIPIFGGARLVGRAGKWDMGFLDMQTNSYEYIEEDTDSLIRLESTNHGVLRLRRQVFNPTSYAGGMVTSKIDVDGNYNINAALDLIYNPFSNDYITANYVQTFDSEFPYSNNLLDHGKFFVNWENRSNVGFSYNFFVARAGQFYDPEMGFEMIENYTQGFGSLSYGWVYNEEEKKMLNQQIMIWGWLNKQNEDFTTDISKTSIGYNLSTKNGYRSRIELIHSFEKLVEEFELSDDTYFPVGEYNYTTLEGGIGTPSNKLIALRTGFTLGTYYDGKILALGPAEITFRISPSVNLSLDYQYSHIDIDARDQYFRSHLARLKTEFTFTTKLSLLMFFQYSSSDHFGINNIRFRYNPWEGNDLYLVYNGNYNTHLTREYPVLPIVHQNTFTLKYTYTFIWNR